MPAITKRDDESYNSQRGSPKKGISSRHGSPQKGSPKKPVKQNKGMYVFRSTIIAWIGLGFPWFTMTLWMLKVLFDWKKNVVIKIVIWIIFPLKRHSARSQSVGPTSTSEGSPKRQARSGSAVPAAAKTQKKTPVTTPTVVERRPRPSKYKVVQFWIKSRLHFI